MKKENNIDQLFKKGMEDPEIPFNELDWQKMAKKLDASEARRRTPLWLYAGAGIAAALLVVLFLFIADQKQVSNNNENTTVLTKPKSEGNNETLPSPALSIPPGTNKYTVERRSEANNTRQQLVSELSTQADSLERSALSKMPMLKGFLAPPVLGDKQQQIALILEHPNASVLTSMPDARALASNREKALLDQNATNGKLTFTLLAAPDITDSKTSVGTKISSNLGLLLTYPVSKKLSVSTGAIYARKLYDYGGKATTVYGQAALPWSLNADCYVIDVPVNVNYQLLKKKNYAVTFNSGLSSYFMLKEEYKYTNADQAGTPQINTLELRNQNQHLLGIANFSISIDRKVSDRVSIGVQPFLKLPLTGIGYYDYNLRSRGVAVSLSIKPFGSKYNTVQQNVNSPKM